MTTLTVAIVQAELHWHDAPANRTMFADYIHSLAGSADLIVLPEMFTTGFTMDAAAHAETMDGDSVAWMREMAAEAKANLCGSLIVDESGAFYNRFINVAPSGELTTYDKRHLFRLADEQHHYAPGQSRVTFDIDGFRFCPMVCYDLRFPVWSRNRGDFDVLIYVANWPSRRHFAWETLLRARAIENLAYGIGVNRNGNDGNGLPYVGGSTVVDYLGADLAALGSDNGVATAVLDLKALREFRERFAFHLDADDFTLSP